MKEESRENYINNKRNCCILVSIRLYKDLNSTGTMDDVDSFEW